jgi:hypothetical protein
MISLIPQHTPVIPSCCISGISVDIEDLVLEFSEKASL